MEKHPASQVQLAKINESPFDTTKWIDRSEQLLLSRQPQPHRGGDDRERITRARQAAEALFAPRPQIAELSAADSLPSTDQPVRKPRVLGISSPAPARLEGVKAPVASKPQTTPEIPRSKFARIRSLIKYGMTVSQVAKVYGVAVGEIERILRQA
ncbi:MAG TPA: hypothetical protein VGR45_08905 [Stellaceae bacterium]|nr:hypothetical protein [Stellaceae bacterium]